MAALNLSLVYFNKLVEILETSPELKKTIRGIALQCGCGAAGAAAGGVVGGPIGALLGTIVGGFIGYANSDDYSSLITVLRNLSEEEKLKLVAKVQQLVGGIAVEDLVAFIQTEIQREMLLKTIGEHVRGG